MTAKRCTIVVKDEVNCLIVGLDQQTKHALRKKMTYYVPGYRFMPKYRMGGWDGTLSLFSDGWTYTNLLDHEVLGVIESAGYDVEIVDERRTIVLDLKPVTETEFAELPGSPVLRDYQVHAINTALENRSGLFVMATGSGKSYVCGAIASRFAEHGKVFVIVPSVNLVMQTMDSFQRLGMTDVGEFSGGEKRLATITVTTWQSLGRYPEVLEGTVCVISDESHLAKAQVLSDILTSAAKNVPFRYGFTGTLPKDALSAAKIRAALGDVLFELSAWELQKEGILASCNINVLQTTERPRAFSDYHEEYNFLVTDERRLSWVARKITEVSASGNTMVLVRNIATGKRLAEMIGPKSVFVSGSTKANDRKSHYESLGSLDGKILICTKGIASTGIDIPRVFNLVLMEAGRSFTEVIQSIGRGLRRAEDKDHVDIWDVCASTKHSKRHLTERKRYYDSAKYPYQITKVDYFGGAIC